MRGHVAIITKPSLHYVPTESTISGRDVVLIPGLLPIFLQSCEIKSGLGLGKRVRALIPQLQTQLLDKICEIKSGNGLGRDWARGTVPGVLGYTQTAVLYHDSCFPVLLLVTAGPVEHTTNTV